jgi:REP element-mobilizing transposase RayT
LILLDISSENSIDFHTEIGYPSCMAARSKRGCTKQVQQELFRRGGKRRGAGRKPKGPRAGAPHQSRPKIAARDVLHVVLRVVPEIGSLRSPAMYSAIRDASVTAAMRERIRIIHVSVQRTHVHMLVEAKDKEALAHGMQGFQISAARNINTALGDGRRRRRGKVFVDRYHLVVARTPSQTRNVLSYLLNNWRKHLEDQTESTRTWLVDRFSSGLLFADWQELEGEPFLWKFPDGYDPIIVYRPQSWLLSEGWKRAGTISARTVPSQRQ